MKIKREDNDGGQEYESVLDLLSQANVMGIEVNEKDFKVFEACYNWYSVTLSPQELRELGRELIALAETKIA